MDGWIDRLIDESNQLLLVTSPRKGWRGLAMWVCCFAT